VGARDADTASRARVVAITGSVLGAAATLTPAFLVFKPNRVVDGVSKSTVEVFGVWGWAIVGMWALAAVLSAVPIPHRLKGYAVGLLGGAASLVTLWQAGVAGTEYTATVGDVARMSLAPAFWIVLLASYVVVFAATAWIRPGWRRVLITYAPILGIVALLVTGRLDSLSIMREYAINSTEFWVQLRLHLIYVLGATACGILIGLPAGLIAARRPKTEPAVFGVLNVLNVLPVLAFIGLLNPLLTWLSETIPALAAINVRGVGWTPVLIVLTAYATYPIARNAYTAMLTLDRSVLDAASGVGMGRWRRLFDLELPLAAPVIIAGIRIALVQTTAGAIIAGLVGGGGLGSFVFLGASQTATDLILMGTIPIVVLGLFFDRFALLFQRSLSRWSVTT